MKNNEDQVVKIQGRLTATQSLWDNEREQILRAVGVTGNVNVRFWTTEALVQEIKDCIEGQKRLAGDGIPKPGQRIDNVVELAPNDAELQRAWKTFPDTVADNHGFQLGICGNRINQRAVGSYFRSRTPSDRIPDCFRACTRSTRMVSLKQLNGPTTILTIQFNYMLCPI
jgi:hypothetical protein